MKKISQKKKEKPKSKSALMLDPKPFKQHLERIFLGGIIEEALIFSDGESVLTTAIDETNAIFCYIQTAVPLWEGQLGIGNVGVLTKFLDNAPGQVSITKDENRLNVKHENGPSLKYMLTSPELISSYNEVQDGVIERLSKKCTHTVSFPKASVESFLYMSGLLKPKIATLLFDAVSVKILGGLETEHQFTVDVGEAEPVEHDVEEEAFEVTVYAEHLKAILGVLKSEDEEPTLLFGKGQPVIVQLDEGNIWALLPVQG